MVYVPLVSKRHSNLRTVQTNQDTLQLAEDSMGCICEPLRTAKCHSEWRVKLFREQIHE